MAKTSVVERQKRREKLVQLNWARRTDLRERSKNIHLTEEERAEARTALNKMRRDTSPSRLKNRCQITGRPRGYLRKFKMSRICLREFCGQGVIPGITKSSW